MRNLARVELVMVGVLAGALGLTDPALAQSSETADHQRPSASAIAAYVVRHNSGAWIGTVEIMIDIDRSRPIGDDRFETLYRASRWSGQVDAPHLQTTDSLRCPALATVLAELAEWPAARLSFPNVRTEDDAASRPPALHAPVYELWAAANLGAPSDTRTTLRATSGPVADWVVATDVALRACW